MITAYAAAHVNLLYCNLSQPPVVAMSGNTYETMSQLFGMASG